MLHNDVTLLEVTGFNSIKSGASMQSEIFPPKTKELLLVLTNYIPTKN